MKTCIKRTATVLLALLVAVTALLTAGCSTPKVAMTVDGTDYTTGEYLAYLYNAFYLNYVSGQLYYYDLYMPDYDVWNQTYTYEDEKYNLADYISVQAQDTIVRQVAVQRLMDEHGIQLSEEDLKEIAAEMKELANDAFLAYGFNNASYERMFREYNFNEHELFFTLYGEGGSRAVAATDIRKYFDDNYLSYKIIAIPLTDANGKELSDDKKQDVADRLNGYWDLYKKDTDFDEVIHQYEADEKAKAEAEAAKTTTTGNGTTTTTAATTTTTTAATTTTGTTTTTTANKDDDHDHADEDADKEEEHNHRTDIDSAKEGDAELVKALKEMKFDEVKVIEYKDSSGTATKALVQKLDPEADRGKDEDGNDVDYFADEHDAILYALKFEEFDKEVEAKADSLTVEINKRAVNACDPYDFRDLYAGA